MSGGGSVDLSNYPKLDVNNTFSGINTFNTETTFRGKIDIDMAFSRDRPLDLKF